MLFRSVYLKTLRDFRVAILGWGLGLGLLVYVVLDSFPSLVATPAARASLVGLAGTFSWLAAPVAVDTPGGYATFKYGVTILVITLWPLVACTRILRGEEEQGSLDVLLSLPLTRLRVAVEKMAAVWTALLLMGALVGVIVYVGGVRVEGDITLGDALLFGLDLALMSALIGGLALLLSQFSHERATASGITGGLLLLFVVMDMAHRVIPDTEWISRLSPVYYFNLSKPLVPTYGTSVGGMLVLFGGALVLTAAGVWLFVRRDVAGVIELPARLGFGRASRPAAALPVREWSLRSVYLRGLAMSARATFWWTVAIGGFAAWMIVIVRQAEAQLQSLTRGSPVLRQIVGSVGGGDPLVNATLLSALFSFLPLLLMAFAVTQSSRWAADEEEGRLELVLATPQSRLRVVLARYAAIATVTVVVGVATLAIAGAAAAAGGLQLDAGHLSAATLSMVPLGLLIAALGYLFAGWLRTSIDTGLLSFLLLAWFVISFIGPELDWPQLTLRVSPFYYYGTPLLHGASAANLVGILAAAAAALAAASLRFVHKDLTA